MKRNKAQIMSDILELCQEEASLTRIVYQCNLNFKSVKPYLEHLIKFGLLETSGERQILYMTTENGKDALKQLDAVRPLFMPVNIPQDQACCP